MKEFQQAKDNFEKANQIFAENQHRKGLYLSEIGILEAMCKYESPKVCVEFAESIQANKDAEHLLNLYKIIGDMYYEHKQYKESYSAYKQALNDLDPNQGKMEAIEMIKKLISVCFKLNQNNEAEKYYELLTRLENTILKPVYLY